MEYLTPDEMEDAARNDRRMMEEEESRVAEKGAEALSAEGLPDVDPEDRLTIPELLTLQTLDAQTEAQEAGDTEYEPQQVRTGAPVYIPSAAPEERDKHEYRLRNPADVEDLRREYQANPAEYMRKRDALRAKIEDVTLRLRLGDDRQQAQAAPAAAPPPDDVGILEARREIEEVKARMRAKKETDELLETRRQIEEVKARMRAKKEAQERARQ